MLESFLHGSLRDLVEGNASDAVGVAATLFLFFLLALVPIAQFFGEMPRDGFAFAVRVRREINAVGGKSQLLQLGENFFFAGNDNVFSFELIVDVDAQRALGQILDVSERGFDRIAFTQIFLNSLGFGR